jgi:glutamate--cysteine ligase
MVQNEIHSKIIKNKDAVMDWFGKNRNEVMLPFYTSVDVRDSGLKVVGVDANLFPAGFNNICPVDKSHISEIVKDYLLSHYGEGLKKIALVTEEHTSNPPYWDNVFALQTMIKEAGYDVRVSIPRSFSGTANMESLSGHKILIYPSQKKDNDIIVGEDFKPDLIISNNDFSQAHEEWAEGANTPINPPREMGWFQRKKSDHFRHYNRLAGELAQVLKLDPWALQVKTELFSGFDLDSEESGEELAKRVDQMLSQLTQDYANRKIEDPPNIFIKNNSGTYGLGVLAVSSADEVRHWNSKTRKQMKVSKGRRTVSEVILQEGVRSTIKTDVGTAEPTIYMVGCELVGGFLRAHPSKGPTESLNSPGAVFQRLCVSDLEVDAEGNPMENVYGWIARLSSLAIGMEMKELGVQLKGYRQHNC